MSPSDGRQRRGDLGRVDPVDGSAELADAGAVISSQNASKRGGRGAEVDGEDRLQPAAQVQDELPHGRQRALVEERRRDVEPPAQPRQVGVHERRLAEGHAADEHVGARCESP